FKRLVLRGASGFDQTWTQQNQPPVIFYGNHQTWWDGFFYVHLLWHYGFEYAIMMEEKNLKRFRFFQKTGVFGVDLDSRLDRGKGVLYAVDWLRKQGPARRRALVIYPHGRLVPEWEPLPDFQPGLARIVQRVENVLAIPVLTRIHYGQHPLPNVDMIIGEPVCRGKGIADNLFAEGLANILTNLSPYFRCNPLCDMRIIWENTKKLRGEA
ncbi:MAG TPA: lysophospholipid acyltransferase family protein, partial [Bacteroidales bacterium]|nr:lysophospholipid acyltransferase family protein [Bacteroidales bacterium]